MKAPKLSIITPTYNMFNYIKRCASSVSDQQVDSEHIIVDGNSSDGTKAWLLETKGVRWVSERDSGMYDALNKGLAMARGEIIGHLNADEQYLPGTLRRISDFFDQHPDVDYVVADFLLVNKEGGLVGFRKSFPLFWPFFFSNYLYAYTCTLFYRRTVAEQLTYNSTWKSVADVDFVYRMIKARFRGAHIRQFVAAYTHTGSNLSEGPETYAERRIYESKHLPFWFKLTRPVFKVVFYFFRIVYGTIWHRGALVYEIYDSTNLQNRKRIVVEKPSYKWAE